MHIIVDGYNVMHALSPDRDWPGRTFQDRRHAFVERMGAYVASRPHRVTVVFDGAKGGDALGGHERHGVVEVAYSCRGEEADDLIRRFLEGAAQPREVLLVSSDKSLAGWARSMGASTAGAHELVRKLMPRTSPATDAASEFERRVKGYRPERTSRTGRARSRCPLTLW